MGCASSSCRPCWPGRIAPWSWPTSVPTSSRSSRPTGDPTRGYGPPWIGPAEEAASGSRPTSCRSIGTSAACAWTCISPRRWRSCRRLIGRSDVLVENFRPGGTGAPWPWRRRAARPEREARSPVDHGLRPRRTRRCQAGLRLCRPGGRRADVRDRLSGRGRRPADEGWRRHQRRRDRAARSGRRAGRGARRRRAAHRHLAARGDAGRAHQPGAERVRDRGAAGAARQRASRTSSRTRRSTRPMARSRSPSRPSVSGRACASRSASTT